MIPLSGSVASEKAILRDVDKVLESIKKMSDKSIKEKFLYYEKEDVYIVKINNILIPENYNSDEKIYLGSDLKNAFGSEIMKNKKISINDSLINALLNQY